VRGHGGYGGYGAREVWAVDDVLDAGPLGDRHRIVVAGHGHVTDDFEHLHLVADGTEHRGFADPGGRGDLVDARG
jgi:hypothetical protein